MNVDDAMAKALETVDVDPAPVTELAPVEAAPEPAPAVEAAPDTETPEAKRARDEAGRFAKDAREKAEKKPEKKPEATPKGGANGAVPPAVAEGQGKPAGAVPPPAPAGTPVVKAPQSWKPEAREAFSKAPPEVQREVLRRESEIARGLQESAQARQFAGQVQESLRPYEGIARANNMDSMTWAGQALQMVAGLTHGTPQHKAGLIARAIAMSGASLDDINAALQGAGPAAAAHPSQPQVDPREEVRRILAEERQKQEEATNRQAIQEFLSSEPEFLEAVLPAMQEILRIDRAKSGNMTPTQAYDRACKLDDGVQSVITQRKAAEAARTPQKVTDAARAAAGSVRHQPSNIPQGKTKGVDAAMEAAKRHLGL